jgi:hypothetical protein
MNGVDCCTNFSSNDPKVEFDVDGVDEIVLVDGIDDAVCVVDDEYSTVRDGVSQERPKTLRIPLLLRIVLGAVLVVVVLVIVVNDDASEIE